MPIQLRPDYSKISAEQLERIANSLEELVQCLKNNNQSSH